MKNYKFDLKNKKEYLVSPTRKVKVNIDYIYNFNNSFGLERKWIILDRHNSIKKIKRLLLPDKMIMLTSFLTTEDSHIKDYLIYIDFGKYSKNGNIIEFKDLELDIIIKKDNTFRIFDIDELIEEFEIKNINKADFYNILKEETILINKFESIGLIETLTQETSKDAIMWLIDLG
ncbi:Protein of unknown function [Marinitoga hydrogenitolerans DSM 16785]|uniref:DUF402 domain-containing protein n=1 Tax=Marinitoga hydrogenitolerans (strain DSM 16785 / JCM 12826 / AT1271) TaxID=1122195 RepID=A0A1M4TW64_MARH1|nr:DUF402 domain-containing protein [Marinitoga hydrogenitolerans]SHE48729.1 Protein of unknown function [Marinitoga hydrogenitolerans DSM 16785]